MQPPWRANHGRRLMGEIVRAADSLQISSYIWPGVGVGSSLVALLSICS